MYNSLIEMAYVFTWSVDVNLWNMTIACALRWGVASIKVYSIGRCSAYMGKHFRCRESPVDGAHSRPQL